MSWFRPLTGWHVLGLMVIFFGVTIGVNATFVTMAVRTHPGEDVPRSYVQGINYNETLDRREQQRELGWSARLNVVDDRLLIQVADRDGEPVGALQLAGSLAHPTDTLRDCPLSFAETRAGVYAVNLPCTDAGSWQLRVSNNGERPFEIEQDLWLQ